MTWPQVIGQIATILITGGVAVLSARYGARSSLGAAERQVQAALEIAEKNNVAALERFRYERIHQKREQVIGELYAALRDLHRRFSSVTTRFVTGEFARDIAEKQTDSFKFEKKLNEVRNYYDRHALWLEARPSEAIDELLFEYTKVIGTFNMTVYWGEGEDTPTEVEYDEALEKLNEWAFGECLILDHSVTEGFRKSLNLDDASGDMTSEVEPSP